MSYVIRGGTVYDGTGAPGVRADVKVEGGRIAAIGEGLAGDIEIDAGGEAVAPGFIDIHTHYDAQVFWDPLLTPSSWHGVTSVVAGNCGFSIAPVRRADRETMIDTLRLVEDMNPDTLAAGVTWDAFETYPEYLDAVAARGVRLNYGGYVGHTAVRIYVMGDEAFERRARPDEIAAMQDIIRAAIKAGAIGFSSSMAGTHIGAGGRPVPSRVADIEEFMALVEPLRDAGRGVISVVAGGPLGRPQIFALQRHADRPLTWTPLLTLPGFDHDAARRENDVARAAGGDVWGQTACRPIVFQETLASPFTLMRTPAFAELASATPEERAAAYRDPAWRARAGEQMVATRPPHWPGVTVSETARRPDLVGRSMSELAAERRCTPLEAMLDVALEDGLATRFNLPVANADPAEVGPLLQAEGVLIGLADSGAHVGQLCDACFATDLLGTWVREREVLTLAEAVRKLTSEPAAFLGLEGRGTLRPGMAADICVFDPETIAPGKLRRIRDFPAEGERLVADAPSGVRHVLVNGRPIRLHGEEVDVEARPGQMLGRA